jgi:hypothetical protein
MSHLQSSTVDCRNDHVMQTDRIRTVGGSRAEYALLLSGAVTSRMHCEHVPTSAIEPGDNLAAVGVAALPVVVAMTLIGSALGLALAIAVQPRQRRNTGAQPLRLLRAPSAAVLALLVMSISGATASAHYVAPQSQAEAQVGPYRLEVRYYGEPVGGRELQFEIVPTTGSETPTQYHAVAVPGPATNAVPVTTRLGSTDHTGVTGAVNLPVSGRWLLSIDVDGPLGAASGDAPIMAAPPAEAMPAVLAWLIGTLPVSVSLTFVAWRVFRWLTSVRVVRARA